MPQTTEPPAGGITSLIVRKLADKSTGTRIVRFDPDTGARKLVNPATPGDDHEPWPLVGVKIEDEIPQRTRLSTSKVTEGIAEGWIEAEGGRPVVRPAGPRQHVWNSSHTGSPHVFMHYDAISLRTVDGPVRFTVVHQPDKYVDDGDDDTPVTPELYEAGQTRVDHFYELALEG